MDAELRLYREAADWFVRLREHPDDPALRARFERWLGADDGHRHAWASVEQGFDEIGRHPPAFAGAAPAASVARFRLRRPRAAAAALALAACVAFFAAPGIQRHLEADYATGTGRMEQVTLTDGSRIELGPDTAVAGGTDGRTVRLLGGQAWFDVAPDPAHPFRVVAGKVTTTVLGTGFDVRMIGDATLVSVHHGKVRVSDAGAAHPRAHDLAAGDWLRIAADHEVEKGAANPELTGAWRDGRIVASGRSVSEIIDEIRPWYGGRIVLADGALGDRRVSGIYDPANPYDALVALVDPHGGRVRRLTPWLLIVGG